MMKPERKKIGPGKRLRFTLEAAVLHALAAVVPLFPRRSVQRAGRFLGWFAYHASPTLRAISLQNLDAAFGETKTSDEKQRIACASLQNVAATLLCLFWAPRLNREVLASLVELDTASLERTLQILASGRGVVFVTLHYGDWELLGQASGFYGFDVVVVQEAMRNESLEEIFARLRGVSGNRLVPNRRAAVTLLKTLKGGGSTALLIDQNATRKRGGVWLDFFGLPAFSHAAAGALALRTGAALVAGVAYPLPDGRARIVYGPEIAYTPADDAQAINQRCLAWCEQVIAERPEYWMWCYKRWTPRATPEQGRYPAYSRYVPDIAPSSFEDSGQALDPLPGERG